MITISLSRSVPKSASATDRPVAEGELSVLGANDERAAKLAGFTGKVGQTLVMAGAGEGPVDVLVGLGKRCEITLDVLRRSAAAYVRAVSHHSAVACTLAEQGGELESGSVVKAVAEGLSLATYAYTDQMGDPEKPTLRRVSLVSAGKGTRKALTEAKAVVASVTLARDLVNTPGGDLNAASFATVAKTMGAEAGLKVTVWDIKRIRKEKLGGLLGVNQGSVNEPRFVTITYTPKNKAVTSVALVGKGVTFDSGGLSLKTGKGMETMKIDMAGGAAVLGAMLALPALGCANKVTAYIPMTDNMPSGLALCPGDVVTARNGKTIEVLNTDAEGRLILADALCLAAEAKPDVIVDIATLTGSVTAALGASYIGIMGTDSAVEAAESASRTTSEKAWHLPLPAEYRSGLESDIADLRNIGRSPYGGALTAGIFLSEFVGDCEWAHLDVGIAALSESDSGIATKGATGIGVRLLIELAMNWTND